MPETITWEAVDAYLGERLLPPDPALDAALAANAAAGLPAINVSPAQGKLLHMLVRMAGARRILEIGTLGGYWTIWLARALPAGGRLITLEATPKHAEVARDEHRPRRAGRPGRAAASARRSRRCRALAGPFDFVFIDADKRATPTTSAGR